MFHVERRIGAIARRNRLQFEQTVRMVLANLH